MTGVEKENLLWLAMAMTVAEDTQERFYYDAQTKLFFSARRLPQAPNRLELFDKQNHLLSDAESSDIAVRLELINDESSEIVEIPRLNIEDKVAIQLLFLSNFDGVMHIQELITKVRNQKDDYKMVLDTILIENDLTAPMASYWDNFKLSTVLEYIKGFATSIGVDLKLL